MGEPITSVNRYCVQADRVDEFLEIIDRCWTVLRDLELVTDRDVEVYLGPERATGEPLVIGIFDWRFAHAWPTTTRHLGVLLDAGLVSVTPDGRQRRYQITQQRVGDVVGLWLRSVGFEVRSTTKAVVSRGAAP